VTMEDVDGYVIQDFQQHGTNWDGTFLNVKVFEEPEEYKLRIISHSKNEAVLNVDLIETFNYLLGLRVVGYRFLKANDRKYTFVMGEKTGRKICVVWRTTKNLELKKDKEVIESILHDYQPNETYVNGGTYPEGCKAIEPEFNVLMWA